MHASCRLSTARPVGHAAVADNAPERREYSCLGCQYKRLMLPCRDTLSRLDHDSAIKAITLRSKRRSACEETLMSTRTGACPLGGNLADLTQAPRAVSLLAVDMVLDIRARLTAALLTVAATMMLRVLIGCVGYSARGRGCARQMEIMVNDRMRQRRLICLAGNEFRLGEADPALVPARARQHLRRGKDDAVRQA